MSKVYGVNAKTKELTICRAKPENRGKGNCPHLDEHIEGDLNNPEFAQQAENLIQKHVNNNTDDFFSTMTKTNNKNDNNKIPLPSSSKLIVQNSPNTLALSREEFDSTSQALTKSIPEDEWDEINKISSLKNKQCKEVRENRVGKLKNVFLSF